MIFIDTGAFLARHLAQDANHKKAVSIWKALHGKSLFTSDHVLDETWTLLGRRAGHAFAAARALNVYTAPTLEIVYSTRDDELDAIQLFSKYADQRVSFTDCVSFVLMRRLRIRKAFTFDRHFVLAGFEAVGLD